MKILVYYRFKIIQLKANKNEKLFSPLLLATLIWLFIPPKEKYKTEVWIFNNGYLHQVFSHSYLILVVAYQI